MIDSPPNINPVIRPPSSSHEPCSEAEIRRLLTEQTMNQKCPEFLNIFKYFQSFHIIFRIFSIVSHHFSNVFKRFYSAWLAQSLHLNPPIFIFNTETNLTP